ncbi:hypothetical protein WICMUC_000147 [Wickerhamomyces mucosus]|uniref:Serine/threonine-protein phosphatase n=1 Tax=Wickerhamomyces mucosus TaxID=1378264 RepID=A0A9P8TJP3_9ASCO|nr:hypothetical protein WICMUC_000147 [Wickerhamomyces mucosus]
MGNTPSKNNNASTSTQSNSNSSLNAGTSTSTSINGSGEPEPDDRKFPSLNNNNNNNNTNFTNTTSNTSGGGSSTKKIKSTKSLKYKHKIQDKSCLNVLKTSDFHYSNEYGEDNDSSLSVNDFDIEIAASMAKALKINSNKPDLNIGKQQEEVLSSYSDDFTMTGSNSSSLSESPDLISPSIVGKSSKLKIQPPLKRKLSIDIDSIIERLLTSSNNNSINHYTDPLLLLPSSSPSSTNSSNSNSLNSLNSEFFISPKEIQIICSKSRECFLNQPSLLRLSAPIKIVGDLHGQFKDLLRILKLSGLPPNSNYLFLGDYVDRGKQSLETILLLLCFKIKYPENFFMLRGNHESANISKIYGFYDECKRRLNLKCWKNFIDVFNTLPLAAIISDKIFCIHGGLSPNLYSMDQILNIQRPTDIPEEGLLADLLWSDPDSSINEWSESDRGVSYCFGKKIVDAFTKKFKFDLIIRGHMVVEDGYEFFAKKKLVTVFSAPNYCGEFNNWGAVMSVDSKLMCSFELLKPNKKFIN